MMKRYDSYKDSEVEWIGEIPKEWKTPRLKHSITESYGGEVIDKSYWGEGHETLYTTSKKIHKSDYPNFNNERRTTKRDLLLSRNGDGIVHIPDDGCIYTNVVQLVRIKDEVDRRFLWYSLTFQIKPLNSYSDGDFIVSLNKEQWFNLLTPLPHLSEQQQIVSFLDTKTSLIDSLIEKTQRKVELLKEKRTSLINEVVTKGLNPNVEMKDSGVEWIGEIPSHWVLSKVMYVLEFHNNIRVPLSSQERGERQGEYRYYGSTGIIDYIDDYLFDGEYILIGEDGSNLRLRTYRLSNVVTGKFWVNNHSHILRSRDGNNHYYSHLLELTDFSNYITGSTQPKLTMDNLKIVPMISPPLSEQEQIVSYLDEQTQLIDKTISIEEKRIELLKEYRQSLISEVVTGKIKVTTDE